MDNSNNPYEAPKASLSEGKQYEYAGFWVRTLAGIIDTILILIITLPLLTFIYGSEYWDSDQFIQGTWDVLVNYILPAIVVIIFWVYKSATPGKIIMGLSIVDSMTGAKPSNAQFIGRYISYYVSCIPLLLGIIWVGIDKRNQGWHDKLAKTLVLKRTTDGSVRFDD